MGKIQHYTKDHLLNIIVDFSFHALTKQNSHGKGDSAMSHSF